jgi:Na+-driven multidrug efflux pump
MKDHILNVFAFLMALSFLAVNKQFAEGMRQNHISRFGRAPGIWLFRIPVIFVSILMLCMSVLNW